MQPPSTRSPWGSGSSGNIMAPGSLLKNVPTTPTPRGPSHADMHTAAQTLLQGPGTGLGPTATVSVGSPPATRAPCAQQLPRSLGADQFMGDGAPAESNERAGHCVLQEQGARRTGGGRPFPPQEEPTQRSSGALRLCPPTLWREPPASICPHLHTLTHTQTCTCSHTCTLPHTHSLSHTYTHAYTHTCVCTLTLPLPAPPTPFQT